MLERQGWLGKDADHRGLEAPGKGTEGFTLQKRRFSRCQTCCSSRVSLEGNSGSSDPSFYIRKLGTKVGLLMGLKRWLSG